MATLRAMPTQKGIGRTGVYSSPFMPNWNDSRSKVSTITEFIKNAHE